MPDHHAAHNLNGNTALLIRLRDGDEAAFDTLVHTYGGPLIGHASRIVGSSDSAREVVQDVFLRLWRDRAHIEPTWDIAAYLYGLTRKRAIDIARSEYAASQRDYRWITQHTNDIGPVSPDDFADEDTSVRTAMWNALAELSPRCREVFLLVWDRQLSYPEISQHLGLAEPTVRRHMSRALQQLADVFGTHVQPPQDI